MIHANYRIKQQLFEKRTAAVLPSCHRGQRRSCQDDMTLTGVSHDSRKGGAMSLEDQAGVSEANS